jgi:PST family polysaccharide transporter
LAEPNSSKRFNRALRWAYVMTLGRQVGTAGVTFVLAALLGPEAFGTVALAAVYIAFLELFLEQGMTNALVQRKDLREDHLDAAFWMILGLSLLLCGVSLALAPVWAGANDLPILTPVISVLAVTLPIRGLTIVQQAWLQREMDFKALAVRTNFSTLGAGAVGIGMALMGYGVWALVAQQIGTALLSLILLWSMSPWRPGMRFHFSAFRELLGFSTGAMLSRLGVFVNRRVDTIVMGMAFGPVAVGLYRLAERLMNLPLEMATRAVQSVSLSEFSRHQDDPERLRESVERSIWISATLTIPVVLGIGAVAHWLLPLLGEDWGQAAPALRLLCVVGAVNAIVILSGPLLQAVGRPHTMAGLVWLWGAVATGSVLALAWWKKDASIGEQLVWLAGIRAAIALLLHLPVHASYLVRLSNMPWSRFFAIVAPSIVSGTLAYGVVALVQGTGVLEELDRLSAFLVATIPAALVALGCLLADPRVREWLRDARATVLRPWQTAE